MSGEQIEFQVTAQQAVPQFNDENIVCPALSCQLLNASLTCLVGPHRPLLRAYLHMLAGINLPVTGRLTHFDQDISCLNTDELWKLRQHIGYFSGIAPSFSLHNVQMNILLPLLYHTNLSFKDGSLQAKRLLERLQCRFALDNFPAQLNHYERAQLSLARALILDPSLLILDLPFNDLGAEQREKMSVLLSTSLAFYCVCMIGGLQYPRFVEDNASQVIYISQHKIMKFTGWTSFKQCRDDEIEAFLGNL